jgi:hypothetical protein
VAHVNGGIGRVRSAIFSACFGFFSGWDRGQHHSRLGGAATDAKGSGETVMPVLNEEE